MPTKYFSYDYSHRLIKVSTADQFESYSYDQYGYLWKIATSKGQTTIFTKNILGLTTQITFPNTDQTLFEYTDGNETKKITAPNGQIHYFSKSIGDIIDSYLTPTNKSTIYNYDSDKRLNKIIKPSGREISYNFKSESGNLENIVTPLGIREYSSIDERNRLKEVISEDAIRLELSWVSDQVKSQKWYDSDGSVLATLSFGYKNNILRINSVSLNGQEFAKYGSGDMVKGGLINNRIECVGGITNATCNSENFSTRYIQDKNGDDNSVKSSISTNFSIVNDQGSTIYRNLTLTKKYDTFGYVSSSSEDVTNNEYGERRTVTSIVPGYDDNNRLTQVLRYKKTYFNSEEKYSDVVSSTYLIPRYSNNNVSEYLHNQKRTIAIHNNDDQLIKLTGSINRDYEYNADGDLVSMTNCNGKTEYEYDVFGNLKKVVLPSGKIIEYKVDGLNRRIKKIVDGEVKEYYIWFDSIHLAAILDGDKQPVVKYIYGPDSATPSLIEKNNVLYKVISEPGINSIRYIINIETKEIVQEIEYDDQGNAVFNSNPQFQPLGFAGGVNDSDTKLIRFGARDYDPTIGRWTTKDPLGFAGGNTNLYGYCSNDPMSCRDPFGLYDMWDFGNDTLTYFAGVGDTVSFGGTAWIRDQTGGANAVDTAATTYKLGEATVLVASIARLTYAVVARVGAATATSAESAVLFRNSLKTFFRGGDTSKNVLHHTLRATKTDAQIIKSAGRTNPYYNGMFTAWGVSAAQGLTCPTN